MMLLVREPKLKASWIPQFTLHTSPGQCILLYNILASHSTVSYKSCHKNSGYLSIYIVVKDVRNVAVFSSSCFIRLP